MTETKEMQKSYHRVGGTVAFVQAGCVKACFRTRCSGWPEERTVCLLAERWCPSPRNDKCGRLDRPLQLKPISGLGFRLGAIGGPDLLWSLVASFGVDW